MKSALTVIKEQLNSIYLILRLSTFELKSENNNNYLGILWEVINPMIQIGIYWFVFGFGIRKGSLVDGHIPYVQWMMAGILVWFFVNQGILTASRSIYTRIRMISKMSFPMSTIPSFIIMTKFYQHLVLAGIVIIIFQFMGAFVNLHYIMLPYFMFCTIAFLFAVSLLTSTLTTIIRDIQQMLQAILRVLFYLTPILWDLEARLEGKHQILLMIVKFNPIYYIVEGYRASLLGTSWYLVSDWKYTLYFWCLVIVLLIIGASVHVKFRDRFVDYL
ncbi:ABC transporter permease [Pullulanibacillus sp. KACC 23026]|uniref:ABC transporter permease n=1 Tax=Pullulanibacillus sp. KACC 23026 TaxID=3028315 RepID=UPI0023AE84A6|nr:ABC transporter permease [Pullulanibacillus sp. KACC 23026]WEG13139.1 ABC transporter permease [Pullulanibacillus sp. KACC 23026]